MEGAVKFLIVLLPVLTVTAPECTYDSSAPEANIGEKMVIRCNLITTCFENKYMWCRVTGTDCTTVENEASDELVVSMNVTSAAEVGGQEYECHCSGDHDNCKKYNIAVKPKVSLSFIPEVVKLRSSVSVICRAESYPPANCIENYQMKHPRNKNITHELLSDGSGVVHKIQAANKDDAGVYECIVTLQPSHYTVPIQSEIYEANLTVYDPPDIIGVTLINVNPFSAILECVINNTELDVWVNWTMSNGKQIEVDHITSRNDDTFYLVLYKAMPGKYMCLLFSTYSLGEPEDTGNASVINGAGSSCDLMTPAKEDVTVAILSTVVVLLVIIATLSITIVVILVMRHRRQRTEQLVVQSEQPTVGRNDNARYDPLSELNMANSATEASREVNHETPTNTSKPGSFAINELFDEKEDELEPVGATNISSTRKDTLPSTENDQDIHTEPPPQPTGEDEEDDDVFDLPASPGLPITQQEEPLLPHDRKRRPSSASRHRSRDLESVEESAAQPRRPGSASRSSGIARRLSLTRASVTSDNTEFKKV